MSSEPKPSSLVISAISTDRTGLVSDISETVFESGGNIEQSRMTVMGVEFALIMLVSGKWNAIAKLENALENLQQQNHAALIWRRTETPSQNGESLPYAVDVIALDQSGLVHRLSSFFASQNVSIHELHTNSYPAAHTGTPMYAVHMDIGIPVSVHVSSLREAFLDHCDRLNIDGVLEPIKG